MNWEPEPWRGPVSTNHWTNPAPPIHDDFYERIHALLAARPHMALVISRESAQMVALGQLVER